MKHDMRQVGLGVGEVDSDVKAYVRHLLVFQNRKACGDEGYPL